MKLRSILTGTAAATALLLSASVQAAPINGTGAVSLVGVSSSTPSIGIGSVLTNTIFSALGGATGDLVPAIGSTFLTNPITATVGSSVSFTAAFGSFSGMISTASIGGPITNLVLDLYVLGTFTPAGVLAGFSAGPMSLTMSYNQTGGPNAAVSGSYTMASPPAEVPEPATLALMGAGLLGLAAVRRRKA
jgi:hypothetical protein